MEHQVDLHYFSGWTAPQVVVNDMRGAETTFPFERIGPGRSTGEHVLRSQVRLSDGAGFFVRGDHGGEDRPPGERLYRPLAGTWWLQDGRFSCARPPTPAALRETLRVPCHPLRHEFVVHLVRPPGDVPGGATTLVLCDGEQQWQPASRHGGWRADLAAQDLVRRGRSRDVLLAAVESHEVRERAYLPDPFGRGEDYVRWLARELLPLLHERGATRAPVRTAILGASYGGAAALLAGLTAPDHFGTVGCLSLACPVDLGEAHDPITMRLRRSGKLPFRRLYLDAGTRWSDGEVGEDNTSHVRQLIAELEARSIREGWSFRGLIAKGHTHDDFSWRQRVPGCLEFLLGP